MSAETAQSIFGHDLNLYPATKNKGHEATWIQREFEYHVRKYLHPDTILEAEVEVETFAGCFRVDFVARRGRRSIGFECDGKDFHDASRDEWRDALILGERNISTIFRIPGDVIYFNLNDCLYAISRYEPNLFSDRGHINLSRLKSEEFSDSVDVKRNSIVIPIGNRRSIVERHSLEHDPFLNRILEFSYSRSSELKKLDSIIAQFRVERNQRI